jgi:hypothetical protein
MPNKENIKIWVAALRSGDYKQIAHFLSRNNKFCCVGVACELAIANKVNVQRNSVRSIDGRHITVGYGIENCTCGVNFPQELCDWLGLNKTILSRYADLNDNGMSFADIADAIEKAYLS